MGYRLICFDIDGTLVQDREGDPYWGTLHDRIAQRDTVQAERSKDFKEGRITYKEWVDRDLGDLQKAGKRKEFFVACARLHSLMPGARETIMELHRRGYRLGVISGSLDVLIETLFPDHPFQDVFANRVFFAEDGSISGWEDTVYDHGTKHEALIAICAREGIPISETVFVGNGDNDIEALREAGLGIAFCPASDAVREAADVVIETPDIREVLVHL